MDLLLDNLSFLHIQDLPQRYHSIVVLDHNTVIPLRQILNVKKTQIVQKKIHGAAMVAFAPRVLVSVTMVNARRMPIVEEGNAALILGIVKYILAHFVQKL